MPLAPQHLEGWLAFFDDEAFCDNPEWGTCYCRCFLFGGRGWEAWDAACASGENRAAMIESIRAGRVDGMIARHEGRVVGWVHFGPTGRFATPVGPLTPAEPRVASIVCFVVSPRHRRSGIARALVRAACDELARRGFVAVDARPATAPEEGAKHLFAGAAGMYLDEGFEVASVPGETYRLRRVLIPSSD